MAKQGKIIHKFPTKKLNQFIEVEVYYTKGGAGMFGGKPVSRGYYLSVMPVTETRTSDGLATMREVTLFCGIKKIIQEAKAFSQSKLDLIAASISKNNPDVRSLVACLLNDAAARPHLYGKAGLQLADPTDIEEKQG